MKNVFLVSFNISLSCLTAAETGTRMQGRQHNHKDYLPFLYLSLSSFCMVGRGFAFISNLEGGGEAP
jgi:hypothetical protein